MIWKALYPLCGAPAWQVLCLLDNAHACLHVYMTSWCTQKNRNAKFAGYLCMRETCLQGQLVFLRLDRNRLSGSLPPSWSSASQVQYVDLAYNSFTGSVPATWSNWTQVGEKPPCLESSAAPCHICICAATT